MRCYHTSHRNPSSRAQSISTGVRKYLGLVLALIVFALNAYPIQAGQAGLPLKEEILPHITIMVTLLFPDGGTDGGTKQIQRRGEGTPALPEKRQYPSHPYEYPDPTPIGDGGVDSGTDGGTKHIQRRGASPQVDKRQAPTGAYDYVDTPAGPKALHTPGPFIQRRDSEEPPTHYPYRVPDGPQKRSAEPLELGPHEPSGTPPISYAYRVPDPVKRSAEPQVSEPVPGPLPKHYLYRMPEKRSAEPQVSDPNEPSDPHVRYWYHNPDKRSAEPQVPDPDEPLDPHRYLYRMPS
jgi:hypothetical protein